MTSDKAVTRRRYSRDFKAQVVAECGAPGASVAKVAMSHRINTNIVHGWRKLARQPAPATAIEQREFVPVQLARPAPPVAVGPGIEVELRRGAVTMKITWPQSAAADLAAWTRELLR